MEDHFSTSLNGEDWKSALMSNARFAFDHTGVSEDIMSSDDGFVSEDDSDLGFYADDAANQLHLSAESTYSGLDIRAEGPEGPWIRLLRLRPAHYDEALSGVLLRRPLYEDGIEYVALSYSWKQGLKEDGERELPTSTLKLRSGTIDISEHLAQALRRLRDRHRCVYVWIDAVCINQRDYDERARQVPLMFQIYGKAAQVCIWLGEPPAISASHKRQWICTQKRPWWSRLWVVQECIYSTQCPIVLLGSKTARLDLFIAWLLPPWWKCQSLDSVEPAKYLQGLYEAWLEHKQTGSAREPLFRRLLQTKDLDCEDFHDRVYALLSLVPESDIAHFVIDYQKTEYDLGIEICSALFTTSAWTYGDLHRACDAIVQLRAQSSTSGQNSTDLPSGLSLAKRSPDENRVLGSEDPITVYSELDGVRLPDMCVERVVHSQLLRGSRSCNLSDCEWTQKLFRGWWEGQLSNLDASDRFLRLCRLHSNISSGFRGEVGVFEWTTLSGTCGFYLSPRQTMNDATVLYQINGNMGLLIDGEKGTHPCYVFSNPKCGYPRRRSNVSLNFFKPTTWYYEFPSSNLPPTATKFHVSESLIIMLDQSTQASPTAYSHYDVGLMIHFRENFEYLHRFFGYSESRHQFQSQSLPHRDSRSLGKAAKRRLRNLIMAAVNKTKRWVAVKE